MSNPSLALQRMLAIIDANHHVLEKNRGAHKQIRDLLGKITTPADRIQSLSIMLEANLIKLSDELNRYAQLERSIKSLQEASE